MLRSAPERLKAQREVLEGFMFQFARRIVADLISRWRPPDTFLNRLGPFSPPEDPYPGVREPRRPNPGGRSSAVALAEPEPSGRVRAVSTVGTRGSHADSNEE
jgi:hypothetical protein